MAILPLKQSTEGGAGSFLVRSDDNDRYWCKVVNNDQSPRLPATEQVVGRLGKLIGAGVCDVSLVWIPDDLAGWEYRPGKQLEAGWAHGSRDVEPVTLASQLEHRANDDNRRRHAGYFALYDWLVGADPQWLIRVPSDWMYFSHDHGHYLPGGPNWSIQSLRDHGADEHRLAQDIAGLDGAELHRLADALEAMTEADIAESLEDLPHEWLSDDELEEVISFASARGGPVADRLRRDAGEQGTQ